ncbi:MAG: aspartate aminotransferase family protein [Terriglobales bacterium]
MGFDFDAVTRQNLGYNLIDWINQYFSSLSDRPVQLPLERRTFEQLPECMPEVARDAASVLDDTCRELIEKGFHVPSANYFGLMNPTPAYMAVLAEALVAALNPQLASLARSQLASKIENQTVRWIGSRVGWQVPFDGTFTSGGNEANFSGLALALSAHFPGVVENGVASIGAQPVLYASSEAHHSIDKSAGLLGIGRNALRRVAVNARLQLDVDKLDALIASDIAAGRKPFAVVATAGTTNSGAIDDLEALGELCRRRDLWLHVDGAYGAAAIISDRHRHLVRGIENADSITIDPHKWLAMPFAAGIVLTSHPELLQQTFAVATPYMPRAGEARLVDHFKISAQWSRRMNSLKLWLTLRVHGRQAYEDLIDRQLKLAARFAEWVQSSPDFELAAPQVLPIVNFRVKAASFDHDEREIAAANQEIVEAITNEGRHWLSTTCVAGRSTIRMMVISYLSEERHLQGLQHALEQAAAKVAHGCPTSA